MILLEMLPDLRYPALIYALEIIEIPGLTVDPRLVLDPDLACLYDKRENRP